VKQAPPSGVEAPAVAAPERQQHAEKSYSSTSLVVDLPETGRMNSPGLGGLTAGGTSGLSTGSFQVKAAQPVSYTIQEVVGLLDLDNEALLRGVVPGSFPSQLAASPTQEIGQRRFVIMDDNVYRLYGERVEQYFTHHSFEYEILPLPTNEANKSFELVFEVADALEKFGINRRKEPIIAIGGGVCLDVAGLAANLFRRNTPLIKVPTTLMAAVDASVGIKTAVNFHEKKNKLGTYCPPLAVFLDRSFLRSLDQRNISNGAAEMLKMACIKDEELFNILEQHAEDIMISKFQGPIAGMAMRRSIQGMLEELEYNLWEHILCRLVDYGHTFSPEIEMAALASGEELLHGEAVNIDMALTTQISCNRGLISPTQRDRVFKVMNALQLPMQHGVCNTKLYMKALRDTTKARDGLQRTPLMAGIGAAVFVNDLEEHEVAAAAAAMGC
jgi:3-dehydroquinate synthase